MSKNIEFEQMKDEYNKIKVPENGLEELKKVIEKAKIEKVKIEIEKENKARAKKQLIRKRMGISIAAAVLLIVLLPNVNVNVAMAMDKIPIIGSIVRVITFGKYNFEDENHAAKVEIPKVEMENPITPENIDADAGELVKIPETVDSLNKDIEDYISPIVDEFKESLSEDYKKAIEISYEVVTDSDTWFTLRIDVLEIQASGYQYEKYYHINKITGDRVYLKDIFREGSDYVGVISEEVIRQMREEMAADEDKSYFIDSPDMPEMDFKQIKQDQNFYWNANDELVIAFDEYEAAPGYMGKVAFTIPDTVIASLLK